MSLTNDISKQSAQAPQIDGDQTVLRPQEISRGQQQEHGLGLGFGF
jgi:hypothetical protein